VWLIYLENHDLFDYYRLFSKNKIAPGFLCLKSPRGVDETSWYNFEGWDACLGHQVYKNKKRPTYVLRELGFGPWERNITRELIAGLPVCALPRRVIIKAPPRFQWPVTIAAAAIKIGEKIYSSGSQIEAVKKYLTSGEPADALISAVEGFLTNEGDFLLPHEADSIARNAGQKLVPPFKSQPWPQLKQPKRSGNAPRTDR